MTPIEDRLMRTFAYALLLAAVAIAFTGCASWDHMSSREKSTIVGAGLGGVVGAAVTNGAVLSTVGGAAIGGVIGNQVGKR